VSKGGPLIKNGSQLHIQAIARQGKCSFLKKRTKKLLPVAAGIRSIAETGCQTNREKVFSSFFQKRTLALPLPSPQNGPP
jgi:hypothetical protein